METIWNGGTSLLRNALQVFGARATWCAIERTPSGAVLLTAQTEHYTASIALSGDAYTVLPAQFTYGWYALGARGRSVYPWAELYRAMLIADAVADTVTVDGYPQWLLPTPSATPSATPTVTIDGRTLPRVALAVAFELARVRSAHYVTLGHVVQDGAPTRLYLIDAGMIVQCDAVGAL